MLQIYEEHLEEAKQSCFFGLQETVSGVISEERGRAGFIPKYFPGNILLFFALSYIFGVSGCGLVGLRRCM